MKRTTTALTLMSCLAVATSAFATGLQITEVYIGIPGEADGTDGTEDFAEISNLGPNTINLGGLFVDDASADPTAGGALPAIDLAPGESLVVLLNVGDEPGDDAAAIAAFETVFGQIDNLIAVPDGGLSGGGDTVNLFTDTGMIDNEGDPIVDIVDSFTYGAADTTGPFGSSGLAGVSPEGVGFGATFENLTGSNNTPDNIIFSVEGVNGAFASNTFLNDSPIFGGTEDDPNTPEDETVFVSAFLIGSPGFVPASAVVPEPTALALSALALTGLGLRRRR